MNPPPLLLVGKFIGLEAGVMSWCSVATDLNGSLGKAAITKRPLYQARRGRKRKKCGGTKAAQRRHLGSTLTPFAGRPFAYPCLGERSEAVCRSRGYLELERDCL
jgi:hypothetical protein